MSHICEHGYFKYLVSFKMDLFVKETGPVTLVNFHLPWSDKFVHYDLFFDAFSNQLIFHNDGYFIVREEYQR